MNNHHAEPIQQTPQPWYARLHAALMPDYNPKAATYWWTMVGLGLVTLFYAGTQVARLPLAAQLQVMIGCAVAMLAGVFPVRIPGSKNSFAAGEIFIFLLLLMVGPSAAVLAAAGEAFVGSMRSSKRWTSRLVSPALASVAMSAAGWTLWAGIEWMQPMGWLNEGVLLLAAMLFAIGYFLLNTALVTVIPHLKRNERMQLRSLLGNFGWVGITYAASSLIAGLLYLTFRSVGIGVLIAAIPIIAMLLSMLHIHFRKRELDDAANLVRVEAAEREAAQSARHVTEMQASEKRFQHAFSNAAIGMALVSTSGRVLQVNSALAGLIGRAEADITGHDFSEFVQCDDPVSLLRRLTPTEQDSAVAAIELRCNHPLSQDVWMSIHAGYFSDRNASEPCLILQAQDITARRQAELRLQHSAYHDSLTGLANRARFSDCLAHAIERRRADASHSFAVMYLDFDRFKLVNDTLGHSVGDKFLVAVSQRIVQLVRPHDLVGRLGGDEFAILIEGLEDENQAIGMAERLQVALCKPYQVDGVEVNSSASIGITFSSIGYNLPDEVLRDADIAMYRAKSSGRARHAVFDSALLAEVSDQVQLEADLRSAIEGDQLSLAYQPIYDLTTGRIVSFEALARWIHPVRGPVAPDIFIPVAEESDLIGALTQRILSRACRQLKAWQTLGSSHAGLRMQVNLSGMDLCNSELAQLVATTLLANGLEAPHLTLEITESKLMTRLDGALETLTRLRDIGVGISVDDFGTGYSSLSYLSTLPISSLKIDRSFVTNMVKTEHNVEIVKAIVMLANALGKTVIAEGIESPAQLTQLRALGCRFGQGYLLAPPLAAEMAQRLLETDPVSSPVQLAPVVIGESASMTIH